MMSATWSDRRIMCAQLNATKERAFLYVQGSAGRINSSKCAQKGRKINFWHRQWKEKRIKAKPKGAQESQLTHEKTRFSLTHVIRTQSAVFQRPQGQNQKRQRQKQNEEHFSVSIASQMRCLFRSTAFYCQRRESERFQKSFKSQTSAGSGERKKRIGAVMSQSDFILLGQQLMCTCRQAPQVMNSRWLGVTHGVDQCVWCWAKRTPSAARIRLKDGQKDTVGLKTKTKSVRSVHFIKFDEKTRHVKNKEALK